MASPVKTAAQNLGLPIEQPEKLNTELTAISQKLKAAPDYLVVASYGQLLSDAVLAWPKIKPVNVHPSLLPRWRGATPLNHTILGGDSEGGTTIQVMAKEMDAGPILAQEKIQIDPRETYQSLHDRLAQISAPLLEKVLLTQPEAKPQSSEDITICKKLDRPDGVCDSATMTAEEIDRKVRGLNPWPGVTMDVQGINLKILETALSSHPKATPVACSSGTLYLVTVQEAGKKAMSGEEWARGKR